MAEAIIPVEQQEIEFYGDDLVAVRGEDGTIWVPVNLLCEALGVSRSGQIERIQRDPVLSEALASCRVTRHEAGEREMACLPLKYVRAWLFGINASRVRAEVRDKLIQYQRDVIEVIDRHFSRAPAADTMNERLMEAMRDNALQQAQLWETMLTEQRRLRATEAFVQALDDRVSDQEKVLWEHERSLAELRDLQESQSAMIARFSDSIHLLPSPSQAVGPAEKAAIKELVDDVVAAAQAKGVRLGQGRNDYPAVWGALKQRFDVAKYDELTLAQYDEVLTWLKAWVKNLA